MLGRVQEGRAVSLVPHELSHLDTTYGWWVYPDFSKRLQQGSFGKLVENYHKSAINEATLLWSIVRWSSAQRSNGATPPELIGITTLYQCRSAKECRDSYTFIIPSARRQGLASEALRLRCNYAFRDRSVDKLQTAVDIENVAAHRLLEKVGYRHWSTCLWRTNEQDVYVLEREHWTVDTE